MSDMLPIATYNLNVEPYTPVPAIDATRPVTIRLTMAAMNPDSYDEDKLPSTLRIIKRNPDYDSDGDVLSNSEEDEEDGEEDEEDEEDREDEEDEEDKKKKGKKQVTKKASNGKKEESESGSDSEGEVQEDDSEEESEVEDDEEFEEYVLATLSPQTQYQQAIDLTIAPEEDVQFVVTGSFAITLSGNYVKHPFDAPFLSESDEEGDEEEEEGEDGHRHHHHYHGDDEEEENSDEYDLTPNEDEVINDELDELEDASDVEGRIEELIDQEDQDKKTKKRKQNEPQESEKTDSKKAKKDKKGTEKKELAEEPKKDKKEKKVEFKKELEEGPTKKPKTKALEGGVIIEDRTIGKGAQAKKGSKVGMRYIGKLKNGKVFDKNTSGKPFVFKLGVGEVIKGWDIGVAGMAVGGERRIVIPAPYAYGKQALPGLPANSELTFDVKLVSLK